MARIRTIKPEFFTSEDIVSLTPLARLFYVGLWCEADREGRLDWKVGTLKMRYLPGDSCDVQELADELTNAGLVVLYEVEGKQYAEIPSFTKHQVINNRESESTRPARVDHASSRVKAEGKEGREGKEREGKGKEGGDDARASSARPTRKCPPDFTVTAEMQAWAVGNAPLVDAAKATASFRDHTFKTAISDWAGAWRNWLRKDQEFAAARAGPVNRPAGKHTGFQSMNYREGVAEDGSFV